MAIIAGTARMFIEDVIFVRLAPYLAAIGTRGGE
jgi:hypothetical protein